MTAESNVGPVLTVVAVLLAIPMLMMGVVMPLMVLGSLGPMAGASRWMLFAPVIPITVFALIGYALYRSREDRSDETTRDSAGPRLSGEREVSRDE